MKVALHDRSLADLELMHRLFVAAQLEAQMG